MYQGSLNSIVLRQCSPLGNVNVGVGLSSREV